MYRSGKGFGLTGVAVAVLFMILTAVFSSSASSAELKVSEKRSQLI